MTPSLENQAIKAALDQNWEKAIEINKQILKTTPKNIAALNRLGRAYGEVSKISSAITTYKKVLAIDPFNPIAGKNLERLSKGGAKKMSQKKVAGPISTTIFLEEPGKTKLVKLARLASWSVLAQLSSGNPVLLAVKKRTVSVIGEDKNYLGTIPEDLSLRLIKLIKGGNQYQAFVKSVDRQQLEILIRELVRGKKFLNIPSFPQGKLSQW